MSPDHSFARIQELLPLIRRFRSSGEKARRMTTAIHEALAHAGVYRANLPTETGGDELSLSEQLRMTEALGSADPSVAWCVANSAAAGLVASRLSPSAMRRVFADPNVFSGFGFFPGGEAETCDGGYLLRGRWPVVSGCHVARRFLLAAFAKDRRRTVKFFVVDSDDAEIEETWNDVSGMRGSGSHAVRTDGAFVPPDWVCDLTKPPRIDRPSYRLHIQLNQVHSGAVLLGAARGAIEHVIGQAAERGEPGVGDWRLRPSMQDILASVDAEVAAARAGLYEIADLVWLEAQHRTEVSRGTRARTYAQIDHAHRSAREAMSRLTTIGGIDCLREGRIVGQTLRDIHVLGVNWERHRQTHYDAGRVLMGLEPLSPSF